MTDASTRDDSVWDRLRRRKVVQWSVAYVAAAWALLQGLEFLAGVYDWPTAFLRVVTLALAVGLPIVVTLAWYHGDRGEQRIGGTELSIVAVLFLLGGRKSPGNLQARGEGQVSRFPDSRLGRSRRAAVVRLHCPRHGGPPSERHAGRA